jgi:hypothetical protein
VDGASTLMAVDETEMHRWGNLMSALREMMLLMMRDGCAISWSISAKEC